MARHVFLAAAAISLVLVPVAIGVAGWDVVTTNLGAALLVMLLVLLVMELVATRRQPTSQSSQGLFINKALFSTALAVATLLANIATITGLDVVAVANELQSPDRRFTPAT
jgi:hypothetical protein